MGGKPVRIIALGAGQRVAAPDMHHVARPLGVGYPLEGAVGLAEFDGGLLLDDVVD